MKKIAVSLLVAWSSCVFAQSYEGFQSRVKSLYQLASISNAQERTSKQEAFIEALQKDDQFPIREKDSVAFIYFGKVKEIIKHS